VTDGEQRASLALVRSLGSHGHYVMVASAHQRSLSGGSRFSRGEFVLPDPLRGAESFVDSLVELIRAERIDLLLPVSEAAILAVLANRARFSDVTIPYPSIERFRQICDKEFVLGRARELGISTPAQIVLKEAANLGGQTASLKFPVVVKPARSVVEGFGGGAKLTVRYANSSTELERIVSRIGNAGFPLLLQERIVGPGVGVFLLIIDGQILASFSHRRIREKPPSGGVSVYRESISLDPQLGGLSQALLERLGWSGVAMVEYKVCDATGIPYLMEINGRFWGSLQLAIDAGVDFPRLLVDATFGHPVASQRVYRTSIRSRWWWGDVDHLIARLRRSSHDLNLPLTAPGRIRALLDFLTLWRPGDRNEILRLTDPWPFVRETVAWIRGR
jgi:predicted ATP-grasp superfamily ATP-dependent carboligase